MDPHRIRRVILYTRVSTDEQADRGYSLRDQEARLRAWCQQNGVEVVAHHQDDHSAKSFERPGWARLLTQVEKSRQPVADAVLVVKWDRFSRDATGALGMIRRLEGRGVGVQAVEQPIDPSVPEQLLMLAIYVAAPEVENRRRGLATKQGMRRAMREGRYVNVPPKGYVRAFDADGKYLIQPGPDAAFVTEAFRTVAERAEVPLEAVRRKLWAAGFRCSRNQFTLLLRNPLYAGRVVVPAWGVEPEEDVEGLHQPLVDAATFAAVQRRLAKPDGRRVARRRLVPEIPLRGHLLCPPGHADAGARLYGSGSRSCTGARVWYYHGLGRGAYRVPAAPVHEAFEAYLADVRLAPEVGRYLRTLADERGAGATAERKRRLDAARDKLQRAEAKLLDVDTRYLDGDLDRESRDRLLAHYRGQRDAARTELVEAEGTANEEPQHLRFATAVMEGLPDVWRAGSPEARDALLSSIWPAGLVFAGGDFRTTPESSVIGLLGGKRAENADARAVETGGRPVRLPG